MDILGTGTASLDLLFMTPEERTAHDASRMLRKLINYIVDHLDDEHPPPSMQNLRNEPFARGFQAGYTEAYKQWGKEGEERSDEAYAAGIRDERKQWMAKQTNAKLCGTPTQTTPTVDAATQTATDVPPRLLNDAGTSTEPPSTCDTASQACGEPPAPPAPATSPPIPVNAATSPLSTAAQPPSTSTTSLTTPTTTCLPASKRPPATRVRRNSLPSQATTFLQTPPPLLSDPEASSAAATSQPTTVATPAATPRETTTKATASTQTDASTSEIDKQAVNNVRRRSTAQQTEPREHARTHSSERVVHSTERPCYPRNPKRRSRSPPTPPSSPLPAPATPVLPPEPMTKPHASARYATSSTRALTTAVFPPALPHPGPTSTALKRRHTLPEPSEHPQVLSHPPCLPQNTQKRAVSLPPASYTPAESPTTPSRPVEAPCPLSTPPSPPVHPCSTMLDPKRAVLPPPARFDWAEDAASLPTAPSTIPRDISCLKTGCLQPFMTLRRRTKQRRAPPRIFSTRKILHSAMPSLISSQPFITRCHPSGIGPGKPIVIVPFRGAPAPAPPAPVLNLDWGSDPRLVDLSQALQALGWTPPC